jgi:type 1 glutamine amidotransferase
MNQLTRWIIPGVILSACVFIGSVLYSAEPAPAGKAAEAKKIRVAVVTGGHGFEEAAFLKFFSGIDGIEFTHVPTKAGEIFQDISDWKYDVILLYSFNQKISDERRANFLKLLDKGVGLFVLHHAIAGFPDWPAYNDLFGCTYLLKPTDVNGKKVQSGYKHDVDVKAHIEDPNCPIVQGMKDFTIHDETYCRYLVDPNVHVFLTTDEPTSEKAIGWVKSHPKARICYIEHGHDHKAWENPNFKQLITQAISWCACRTPLGDVSPNGATAASRPVEKKNQ